MSFPDGTMYITTNADYVVFFIFMYAFSFINFWVRAVFTSGIGPLERTSKFMSYVMSTGIAFIAILLIDLWCINSTIDDSALLVLSVCYGITSINRFRMYSHKEDMIKGERPIIAILPNKHVWECELRSNRRMIKFSTYGMRIFICIMYMYITAKNPLMLRYSLFRVLVAALAATAIIDIVDVACMFAVVKLSEKAAAERRAATETEITSQTDEESVDVADNSSDKHKEQ